MTSENLDSLSRVVFVPHGGGPLPLLGDENHLALTQFLNDIPSRLGKPSAILVISAHWEEELPTLTAAEQPDILYDYYGFPEESYRIRYDAPGFPELAAEIQDLIHQGGFKAALDPNRGYDHGLFVPLKLMYPEAKIPCIQLSLMKNLDPAAHLNLGKSLATLRKRNVLIVGTGMSFHNMKAFFAPDVGNEQNNSFEDWLIETCTNERLTVEEREQRLINWEKVPSSRFCQPREEHLIPLHVCFGAAAAQTPVAELVFNQPVLGKRVSGFLW